MSKAVTIIHNATVAKLHDAEREVKLLVSSALSYTVEGHEHSMKFKNGSWDGKSSFFDFRQATFDAGFVHLVTAHLRRAGYEVRHACKPRPEPLGPLNPKVDDLPDDPNYEYQDAVVDRLLKHYQIIAQVATGGGKSRIARKCIARINRPTLFLTTRSVLMYQMKRSIEEDMKRQVSVLGDGEFGHMITGDDGLKRQAVKKICVGMVQTLSSRLEETTFKIELQTLEAANAKKPKDRQLDLAQLKYEAQKRFDAKVAMREQTIRLLGMFEFVILEEAHEVSSDSFYKIMRLCKNAHYRLALTATPFMKDDEEANMRLHAVSGPIGIRVTEKELIDKGILAKPIFKYIKLSKKPEHLGRRTSWQAAYRLGITENPERTMAVVKEATRGAMHGLPVMILVQHKAHGATITDALAEAGLTVAFIKGENDQDERNFALKALGTGAVQAVVGTNILDVGVDVPAVGIVILAAGGKAEVTLRQRVGRSLRRKRSGPNIAFVVDFQDGFNEVLIRHYQQRREIIESTPGFVEGILPPGADFDYSVFAERRAA
jgi:superfamily II DNA or RNA helicase